jgi:hypothetical protein
MMKIERIWIAPTTYIMEALRQEGGIDKGLMQIQGMEAGKRRRLLSHFSPQGGHSWPRVCDFGSPKI